MESNRTKKLQTRQSAPNSAILYPHPVPYIISIHENLLNLPVVHAVKNSATILHTHTTLSKVRPFKESGNVWA